MSLDLLLKKTKKILPQFSEVSITPINTGGSDRKFYRLTTPQKKSLVLVLYSHLKEENKYYASHAAFLKSHCLNVPEVIAHAPEDGLLWLQDLGETDLWNQREKSWTEQRPLYESTLTQIARFHRIPIDAPEKAGSILQKEFDAELYQWEQDYFLEHGLGGLFNIDQKTRNNLAANSSLKNLARSLAALPRQLIHRDLQSQNVMLHEGKTWLIDFQGLRLGLAAYDLASLLYDPYVTLSEEERDGLLHFYEAEMNSYGLALPSHFKKIFFSCAAQRLMQAIGAYGFISNHTGKTHYRAYAAPALTRLREVLQKLEPEHRAWELEELLAKIL
ncbi:MAG: aminoglycoside phosphotransferase family protein [Chthoniobacterales bacterium]